MNYLKASGRWSLELYCIFSKVLLETPGEGKERGSSKTLIYIQMGAGQDVSSAPVVSSDQKTWRDLKDGTEAYAARSAACVPWSLDTACETDRRR